MSGLFDDFITFEMTEEDKQENEEALERLNDELSTLEDELFTLDCNEPDDIESASYTRWSARKALLEQQISDVESEISDLECNFDF